jgi:BMFP domain-containing protein YqiC
MQRDKQSKIAELKARLAELKKRDPSHCSDTATYVDHTIPPALYAQIEELEDQIKALEAGT